MKSQRVAPHPVLTNYYPEEASRRQKVDAMFDSSAKHYDWITSAMSFGSGTWYRRQALLRNGMQAGMKVLDVGAGTGVVSLLSQQIVGDSGYVAALDPSRGMLEEGKKQGVEHCIMGLGERIPFADNTFDRVTMGYALRHVADLSAAFSEYLRVLKPGGKILLLEITRPKGKVAYTLTKFYLKSVIPTITRLFRHSEEAQELMRYYWDTIEQCVPPETILNAMEGVGVVNPQRHVVMSIFSEYSGEKAV